VITGSPSTQILLPESNAEKFRENLSNWTKALSSWTAHKVTAARERIESIAARFKTTPEIIREANSIPANMHPKAGSTVLVPKLATSPDKDISQEIADNAMLAVEADEPPRKKISVKVSKRDTIDSIAKRYKVKVADIRQWNGMKDDKLTPGQSLKLEVRAPKKGKIKTDKSSEGRRPKHGQSEHQRQHR
jgi:membrane-bound lytic murein transglycosylase D